MSEADDLLAAKSLFLRTHEQYRHGRGAHDLLRVATHDEPPDATAEAAEYELDQVEQALKLLGAGGGAR